jgi:uncharacterized protein YgiB involved in biofilm formation
MKRSKTVSLVAMGLAPLLLGGCNKPKASVRGFADLDACTHAGIPENDCVTAYGSAEVAALHYAPSFTTREQCEAKYDPSDCESYPVSAGVIGWRPAMKGFLVRRILDNYAATYAPGGPYFVLRNGSDYSPQWSDISLDTGPSRGSAPWQPVGTGGLGRFSTGSWQTVDVSEDGEGETVGRGGFGGEEGGS